MNVIYKKRYPPYSPLFWKAYFIQMRPYLLFVSGIAGAAGIAMSQNADNAKWKSYVASILFFLGYGFGQALTDCFQTDTDKLSAPYRPLSKEIISIPAVLSVSIAGLLSSGILFYLLHPVTFWLCLLAVFGLATYSFIKKNYWFGGPFYNAWIVALLPVMGYFACMDRSVTRLPAQLYPCIGITFVSYANFVLIGYLKDIEADKATNYKTFPVIFGWNKTLLAGDFFAIIAIILYWWLPLKNLRELIFGIAGTIIIIAGQVMGHLTNDKNEKGALIPILSTVRGFILLHSALVLHFEPNWWIAVAVYYLLFEWALNKRPSKYQV